MSPPKAADLGALIAALHEGGVEFIIVGGAAAVLHGAPVATLDLDIVPEQSSPNVARLLSVLRSTPGSARASLDLAEREMEVLQLLALGKSNLDIADQLSISEATVKGHVYNTLGVTSRTQALLAAIERGLTRL